MRSCSLAAVASSRVRMSDEKRPGMMLLVTEMTPWWKGGEERGRVGRWKGWVGGREWVDRTGNGSGPERRERRQAGQALWHTTRQSRAGQGRAEQSRAEQSRAEQSRAAFSQSGISRAEQGPDVHSRVHRAGSRSRPGRAL
jgi:hypothetical protein